MGTIVTSDPARARRGGWLDERVQRRRRLFGVIATAAVLLVAYGTGAVDALPGQDTTTPAQETTTSSGLCVPPTDPDCGPPLTTTTTQAPTTTSTVATTTTDEVTTTTEAFITPIETTTTSELTTSTNLLIPGNGTKGAESTTTTTAEIDEAGSGLSDGTIVWSIVAALVFIALAVGFLTWRYWLATTPRPLGADDALTQQTPTVHTGPSVFGDA